MTSIARAPKQSMAYDIEVVSLEYVLQLSCKSFALIFFYIQGSGRSLKPKDWNY